MVEAKVGLCQDIARGLDALHAHGVVHSDIKMSNVLITHDATRLVSMSSSEPSIRCTRDSPFTAKIADFGSSAVLEDCEGENAELIARTDNYAALEVIQGRPIRKVDIHKIDIYSAGLVFCEILMDGKGFWNAAAEFNINNYEPLKPEQMLELRFTDRVVEVAKAAIQQHEARTEGIITELGERIMLWSEISYTPVQIEVFQEIIGTCLRLDPDDRADSLMAALKPWHKVTTVESLVGVNGKIKSSI
ncbi:kinase-like protein [Choiromyces venosus 120613-1]|uniref:Kinase-like protein n=1 Tax=Choiromyces venosus 120613-1 TaxID=1336337 RepID=A0A3N4JMB0_9PEZI|nr:kinase-like protein [Choiromyces venosus 120613-1]